MHRPAFEIPYGRKCLELVVNDSETVVQHARATDELHVRAETGQIVERQHDTPNDAWLAVCCRHGVHVKDVHRYADQDEIS